MFKMVDLMLRLYPKIDEIRARDAAPLAEKGEIVLIDVREPREIARFGKCKGAIEVPMHMIRHKADPNGPHFDPALDPARTFAIYCENGARSLAAARIMKKLGYEKVYNMGSFLEWLNARLPVEK
ncbi:rhodanese-like domain-containing protein [Rhodovulum sp.]|uniref:rhodanese-like domain-containing protein n=1 Tax=Rhodovulum sp. TaxID=34009 RepID=UPI0017A5AFDB|nr:rhodanese-like domain-containing protein [Rhodovulum sp.]HDR28546.1 sulfurtransferase [Rhodovulum sp.]